MRPQAQRVLVARQHEQDGICTGEGNVLDDARHQHLARLRGDEDVGEPGQTVVGVYRNLQLTVRSQDSRAGELLHVPRMEGPSW